MHQRNSVMHNLHKTTLPLCMCKVKTSVIREMIVVRDSFSGMLRQPQPDTAVSAPAIVIATLSNAQRQWNA